MKLKIGDSVKIREDLEKNVWYGKNTAVSSMIILAGKEAKITDVFKDDEYSIDIDHSRWKWTKKMFQSDENDEEDEEYEDLEDKQKRKVLVCVQMNEEEDISTFEEYGITKAAKQALKNGGVAKVAFGNCMWGDLEAKVEITFFEHIDMQLVNYVASKPKKVTFFYKYYCLDEKELEEEK